MAFKVATNFIAFGYAKNKVEDHAANMMEMIETGNKTLMEHSSNICWPTVVINLTGAV